MCVTLSMHWREVTAVEDIMSCHTDGAMEGQCGRSSSQHMEASDGLLAWLLAN